MRVSGDVTPTGDLGAVIGGYRLERRIASGGMGHVYAATHVKLGRSAAVKILSSRLSQDESMLSRFFHEARIVNQLRHPNIIDIFDFLELEDPRRVACIMEYLRGPTLKDLLSLGPLSITAAVNLTRQLVDALAAVHALGVIHRDLKPENVVVIGAPGSDFAAVPSLKLVDFGIAKVSDSRTTHHTGTDMLLGTPAYMAPEQIGGGKVSAKTDVYAIGEILFEMLTGRKLFVGDRMEVFRTKLSMQAPDLSLLELSPAAGLARLVGSAVDPVSECRPGLDELAAELQRFGPAPLPAKGTPAAELSSSVGLAPVGSIDHSVVTDNVAEVLATEPLQAETARTAPSGGELAAPEPFLEPTWSVDRSAEALDSVSPTLSVPESVVETSRLDRAAIEAEPAPPPYVFDVPVPVPALEQAVVAPPEPGRPLPPHLDKGPAFGEHRSRSVLSGGIPAFDLGAASSRGYDAPLPVSELAVRLNYVRTTAPRLGLEEEAETSARAVPERWRRFGLISAIAAVLTLTLTVELMHKSGQAPEAPPEDLARQEIIYRAHIARWRNELGVPAERFEAQLTDARNKHLLDTPKDYVAADESYRRALMIDPKHPAGLAAWAQNLVIWKGDALSDSELEAARAFVAIAQRSGRSVGAVSRARAAILLLTGDLEGARQAAEVSLAREAGDAEARLLLATALAPVEPERALEELERAVKTLPKLRRAEVVRARILASGARYARALKALDARLKKEPKSVAALRLYGDLERELGRVTKARVRYGQAIGGDGDRNGARLALGGMLLAIGDHRAAEDAFRVVADDASTPGGQRARAALGLAKALHALGRGQESSTALAPALAAARVDPAALLLQAELMLDGGNTTRAAELAASVVAEVRDPSALVLLARTHAARGQAREAAMAFADASAARPEDAELRALWAAHWIGVGSSSTAVEIMRGATRFDPLLAIDDPGRDLLGLSPAVVKAATDKLEEAAKEGALRADVSAFLGLVHQQQGNRARAKVLVDQAVAAGKPSALVLLADTHLGLTLSQAARADTSSAMWVALAPDDAMPHLMRARALMKRGQPKEARKEYAIALSKEPGLYLARVEQAALELQGSGEEGVKALIAAVRARPWVPEARGIAVGSNL